MVGVTLLAVIPSTLAGQAIQAFGRSALTASELARPAAEPVWFTVRDRRMFPSQDALSSESTVEFVSGIVAGLLVGALAYRIAESIADDRTVRGDAGFSPAGNVAFIPGTVAGAATGVYAVHRFHGRHGSFDRALLGAAIPGLLMLIGVREPYMPLIATVLVIPTQSLGARRALHR